MTTTAERFWVEITPRRAAVRTEGPTDLPRLTGLAAAAGLEGADLDAELASVHRQMSALAAYRAGLIERKATLGARQPLPFAPGPAPTPVRTLMSMTRRCRRPMTSCPTRSRSC